MALKFAVNNSLSAVTTVPTAISDTFGSMTLLQTQTASSSASIEFTTGIDSTYDSYVFKFINIHGASEQELVMDFSSDGGSTYDKLYTTTFFRAFHDEADTTTLLGYTGTRDLANSSSRPFLSIPIGTGADENASGFMQLYNPSSSTFVKHFISQVNVYDGTYSQLCNVAGYCDTTSSINAVKFEMDGGNIDDGIIKMYGVA